MELCGGILNNTGDIWSFQNRFWREQLRRIRRKKQLQEMLLKSFTAQNLLSEIKMTLKNQR
jgi:hypothetical protein